MYIPTERLIDGVMETLRDDVLPAVASARTRGRIWAALDVLNNLRDRVETKSWLLRAEAESATDALDACAQALQQAGHPSEAEAIFRAREGIPDADSSESERVASLRKLLAETLDRLAALPDETASRAGAAIDTHLASQALRDVMALKPSLLTEISKG